MKIVIKDIHIPAAWIKVEEVTDDDAAVLEACGYVKSGAGEDGVEVWMRKPCACSSK